MQIPVLLLIDGNNLAHFLYTNLVPGQKMTAALSQRLVSHLDSYARSYPDLQIELCLDRSPGDFDLPVENLLVLAAQYPQTGDDLLLDRFWYHRYSGQACLVITNDEAILEEVQQAGGATLRVYDFVRRPGLTTPVFRAPDELPELTSPVSASAEDARPSLSASIYFRIVEEQRLPRERIKPGPQPAQMPPRRKPPQLKPRPSTPSPMPESPAGTAAEPDTEREPVLESETAGEDSPAASEVGLVSDNGPFYFLSLANWPVGEGVRFLLNAFCPPHREEYQDLIAAFDSERLDPERLDSSDLRALAELLLHACGDEPEFARRGSLMARVRLALLQARGEPLSLEQMAERTGLKLPGLQGRIKAKAGRWVEILIL